MQEKRAWLIGLVLVAVTGCATTKTYSPPAAVGVRPRTGMLRGAKLAVGIYDARSDTTNFEPTSEAIGGAIRRAYPDADVVLLAPELVHADATDGAITVRIAVAGHVADFGRKITMAVGQVGGLFVLGAVPEGRWNGLSGFVVTIIDRRRAEYEPKSQSIRNLVSKPNTWGYRTARAALDEAFSASVRELLLILDVSLAR